jgi:pimeloyl-ACP methyl ester carboxylesterase
LKHHRSITITKVTMSVQLLHFKSINPASARTLLLLHGAFSSHHEWDLVIQTGHLDSYHLLVPDLPSHGQSTSSSLPFNLSDTAALLVVLITKHAKDGKADLVGMSLGGYTSIYLASKYPELIGEKGLFVSGCWQGWPPAGGWMSWAYGLVLFCSGWISTHLPPSIWS